MKTSFLINWINRLDAHYRLYYSVGLAFLCFLFTFQHYSSFICITGTWLAFSGSSLLFSWVTILTSHPVQVRKNAKIQDSSRSLIFLIVLFASLISLFAVVLLLQSAHGNPTPERTPYTILPMASVLCAWCLVHTTFTFRYAHLFYSNLAEIGGQRKIGGLEFPKETQPDYLDFTYFSFVIGMTFQVSDVEISSRQIRRLALLHGAVSFIFNTFILALSINIILSIIQK